jgi:hypothetical protein
MDRFVRVRMPTATYHSFVSAVVVPWMTVAVTVRNTPFSSMYETSIVSSAAAAGVMHTAIMIDSTIAMIF